MKTHIEIVKHKKYPNQDVIDLLWAYLTRGNVTVRPNDVVRCNGLEELSPHIHSYVVDLKSPWPVPKEDVVFDVYTLTESGQNVLDIGGDSEADSITTSGYHWMLPNAEFHGLWEGLIYDDGVKENLVKYVETIMHFSAHNIDPNTISCNRLVLLHGPPGTGKTSLCKSLCQKLSIRFYNKYNYIHLVEINSHSLFSKWFSESGKLVMKLFGQIREIVEHPQSLVCILIDEIESIAFERNSISSSEPSDSLRVVNAVLTQLDQIRKFSNVLILTTSNLTSAIDFAFLDRADIRQFIGPPNAQAIAKIYDSILEELLQRSVLGERDLTGDAYQEELRSLAELSVGMSGRTLRKVPILAHAYFTEHSFSNETIRQMPLTEFMAAMRQAILKHKAESSGLKSSSEDKKKENL